MCGNLFLLDKPEMMPVQVSRNVAPEALAVRRSEALEQAWRGTVMVCEAARCLTVLRGRKRGNLK